MVSCSRSRFFAWLAFAALSVATAGLYGQVATSFDESSGWRPILFLLLGVAMVGLVLLAPQWKQRRYEAAFLLGLASSLRLLLLPAAASDDAYRYLWEGKLVREGISPYALRGDHPDLEPYRDQYWEGMNNKDKLTAYPPGSMLAFAAIGALGYDLSTLKVAFALIDFGMVVFIFLILRRRRLPVRQLGYYAFNPVVLVSFAGEGHFDALMLAGVVACLWAIDRRAWLWAGAALGLAVQMKFVAVLGLPLLLWKGRVRAGLGFVGTVVLLALPFWSSIPALFDGLYSFGAERRFNGSGLIAGELLGVSESSLQPFLLGGFLVAFALPWIVKRGRDSWASHWQWQIGSLLIFAPTLHFWYLSWLAVTMALRPSLLWMLLSVSQAVYFWVWQNYAATGDWDLTVWQSALLWSPLFLLAIPYGLKSFQDWRGSRGVVEIPQRSAEDSWLLVVPTYNAASRLRSCLESLRTDLRSQDRIVVCDGGSSDGTLRIAEQMGVDVVSAERGRGNQIAAGLKRFASRHALIAHADCRLPESFLDDLRTHMVKSPEVVGGCLGQRFDRNGLLPYRFIEFLNELRAQNWGIAFGDQAQFFDRAALSNERFPRQSLMEDVELSLRLRAMGELSYLGRECASDSAKWKQAAPLRFKLVLGLLLTYGWQRFWKPDKAAEIGNRLYGKYYS